MTISLFYEALKKVVKDGIATGTVARCRSTNLEWDKILSNLILVFLSGHHDWCFDLRTAVQTDAGHVFPEL